MAESTDRVARLTAAYRSILAHYEEIERLSEEERDVLLEPTGEIHRVNEVLARKKAVLAEIRDEEERVKGAREWWKKVRRTLPPGAGRDLLSLLDAISRAVERLLALESECRRLLEQKTAWGRNQQPVPSAAGARFGANAAYGRTASFEGDRS
ncbi:MAG: hypothetical protein DHS20C21_17480 [Gemmatimonadota bacterium]|nr:MAG: hypothetical protein DHS20C21_17480 [Gemmatimonadota bacterium]